MDAEFRRAVEAFKKEASLTPAELPYFQFNGVDDVLKTLGDIQSHHSAQKRLLFMKRINPFVKTMIEFGKVVEVFLNASDILAFVWGPFKFLLSITSNFADAFDKLLDVYQLIGEEIPLLQSYQDLFSTQSHMQTLLVKMYKDILSFHLLALRYFRKKSWRQLFQSSWRGFTLDIENLKGNLSRHRYLIENRASLIDFERAQASRALVESEFRNYRDVENRRRRTTVFQWLAAPNVDAVHEQHVKARSSNPSSCRWILGDGLFQKWFDRIYCSTPLLWINGKPGAGKSVLASMIVDEAKKFQDISVAYFYCRFGNSDKDRFLSIARALLSQLLAQNESLLLFFEDRMSTSGGCGVLSELDIALDLLNTALRSRKTYVILDGIDEYRRDQRKQICEWFRKIIDSLPHRKKDEIRCLFVSQDDGIARKDFSLLPSLSIDSASNKADIITFAGYWQAKIEGKFGSLREHGLDLVEIVPARSQGLFIFAKCVLEELYEQPSRHHLLQEWRAELFPEELHQVYDRILFRLMDQQAKSKKEIIQKLLSWVSLSKRPLRWFEIQAAISIDIDLRDEMIDEYDQNEGLREDRRLVDSAKDLCASFVDVHSDQTIQLVHSTVRDFLKNKGTIVESQVDLELCLLSLSYLVFPDFGTEADESALDRSVLSGRCSFYDYAVSCWHLHLVSWLSHDDHKEPDLVELEERLGAFLDQHFVGDGAIAKIHAETHKKLKRLEQFEQYESLAQAVVWCKKQLLVDNTPGNILDFPSITDNIRFSLERIAQSALAADQIALEAYYGPGWFKCPKMYCRHFFDGFTSKSSRDKHVERHERPHVCTFERCHMATFGLKSSKELEEHMLKDHGILPSLAGKDEFPKVSKPVSEAKAAGYKFQCSRCSRRFTRKFTLRAHERTHTDERPFVCPVCNLSFVRRHDQQEHTSRHNPEDKAKVHESEVKFRCLGELNTGAPWGCGRTYQREQDFARHLRSDAGKKCIQPLRDQVAREEEEERREGGSSNLSGRETQDIFASAIRGTSGLPLTDDPDAMEVELPSSSD